MSAHAILPIKERLIRLNQQESRSLFEQLLTCRTSAQIHQALSAFQARLELNDKESSIRMKGYCSQVLLQRLSHNPAGQVDARRNQISVYNNSFIKPVAPAFSISSRIPGVEVTLRPSRFWLRDKHPARMTDLADWFSADQFFRELQHFRISAKLVWRPTAWHRETRQLRLSSSSKDKSATAGTPYLPIWCFLSQAPQKKQSHLLREYDIQGTKIPNLQFVVK